MEHWTELRSALAVARLGTVKAAAEELGVHRATINRHVDILESYLGVPLFQRHAKGYTVSDTGRDMMEVAGRAEEMFRDFAGRSSGSAEQLSGSLKITSLAGVAPLVVPIIQDFHLAHSEIDLEFIADEQLARLEYGEAHIAIRAGAKPDTPDYVVLPFRKVRFGLYASTEYVKRQGQPTSRNLSKHKLIAPLNTPTALPYAKWVNSQFKRESVVLHTTSQQVVTTSVKQGLGMGFIADYEPEVPGLVEILPPADEWSFDLWLVTHADLRRTLKVQEFLKFARDQ